MLGLNLAALLVKTVVKRLSEDVMRRIPVGGEHRATGIARGIKAFGRRWKIDVVFVRERDE